MGQEKLLKTQGVPKNGGNFAIPVEITSKFHRMYRNRSRISNECFIFGSVFQVEPSGSPSLSCLDLFYNAGEVRKQDTVTNSPGQRMEQNSPKTQTVFLKSPRKKKKKRKRKPSLISSWKKKHHNFLSLEQRSNVRRCFCHADTNSAGKKNNPHFARPFSGLQQTEA